MGSQLYELFSNDPEIQNLLILQDASRSEILKELGWSLTTYETVVKGKKRRMARLLNEGKISPVPNVSVFALRSWRR